MDISLYQVDAFTAQVFAGNPAAVCPLEVWLADEILQAIAAENNLSETAFLVPVGEAYEIRWFTPQVEVDLCGHATLACAHVLFEHLGYENATVVLHSRSGDLRVCRKGDWLEMDFPATYPQHCAIPEALESALGTAAELVMAGDDYLVVVADEDQVRAVQPDMRLLRSLPLRGVIVTAPGRGSDFVSRFFAPKCGIDEDPVTGSAHCLLAPYWAERLGKDALVGYQVSPRGGQVHCLMKGNRVVLSGQAVTYLQGTIQI